MNKKVIIGSIIAVVVIVVGFFGYQNQMKKQGDENIIKIGAILPLTGNLAAVGEDVKKGLIMFSEESAQSGSTKYIVEFEDSKGDPKQGLMAMQKLISVKPKISAIASAVSGVTLNAQTISEKEGIILFAAVGADNLISQQTKYTYRFYPTSRQVANGLINYIKKEIQNPVLAIVYPNTTFGDSYKNATVQACENNKIIIDAVVDYDVTMSTYRNILSNINFSTTNVIYIIGTGEQLGLLIKAARESGYNGLIMCDLNLSESSKLAAGDGIKNVKYLTYSIFNEERIASFKKKFRDKFGHEPEFNSIIPHDIFSFYKFINENYGKEAWSDKKVIESIVFPGFLGDFTIKNFEIQLPLKVVDAR